MWYHRRPNELILTTTARAITAINTGTNTITVSNAPSSWTTSTEFDLIQLGPPHEILAEEQTPSAIVSNDITFSSLPDDLAVGDYICLTGETVVPNFPYEAHLLLARKTAMEICSMQEDADGLTKQANLYNMAKAGLIKLLSDRNEGEPEPLVNYNSFIEDW